MNWYLKAVKNPQREPEDYMTLHCIISCTPSKINKSNRLLRKTNQHYIYYSSYIILINKQNNSQVVVSGNTMFAFWFLYDPCIQFISVILNRFLPILFGICIQR